MVHFNVTEHPTAEWTIQQFCEFLAFDHPYRFLVHDQDTKFNLEFDSALRTFGMRGLKTPVRRPTANSYCERMIGSIRRDCLDYTIPFDERHLRSVLKEYLIHFSRRRPHSALGPGIPEPLQVKVPDEPHRHKLPPNARVKSVSVPGGLHHEYSLEKEAA
jgi:transposase InsO family protein